MANYTKFKDGDQVRLIGQHIWNGRDFNNVPAKSTGVVVGKYNDPSEADNPSHPSVVVEFPQPHGEHWVSESALEFVIEPATEDEVAEAIRSILETP